MLSRNRRCYLLPPLSKRTVAAARPDLLASGRNKASTRRATLLIQPCSPHARTHEGRQHP
jgi:hypothetical protein